MNRRGGDELNALESIALRMKATAERTNGAAVERLSENVIIEYIQTLPSLILTKEDGFVWERIELIPYAEAFWPGRPFRIVQIQTAKGYKDKRGETEITPTFHNLINFREKPKGELPIESVKAEKELGDNIIDEDLIGIIQWNEKMRATIKYTLDKMEDHCQWNKEGTWGKISIEAWENIRIGLERAISGRSR